VDYNPPHQEDIFVLADNDGIPEEVALSQVKIE
jgi:hypothetical protein